MAPKISLVPLAVQLRGQLPRLIARRRRDGYGWARIAKEIYATYGVDVDGRTVRDWYNIHRHRNGKTAA
jgi:hypothetical protein